MKVAADWQFHSVPASAVAEKLNVDPSIGLTATEAARRLVQAGPNLLPVARAPGIAQLILHQFRSVLIYVLLAAAGLSLLLGDLLEFFAILLIALLNAGLGFAQEFRAEQALRALQDLSAPSATLLRDARSVRLPAADIVPGDILLLEAGDIVPADARVLEAASLAASEALLTGESLPVDKTPEPIDAATVLADRSSMVYQGTTVARGHGKALAVTTGRQTEMGRIATLVVSQPRQETRLQQELSDVGRYLAVAAALAGVIVFLVGVMREIAITEMLLIGASLAVAAIPEGLPAAATLVLALGVQRLAARHVIVRRLASVETLGSVTTIFTDKTGTLTLNQMTVEEAWTAADETSLLRVAVLCNNASLGDGDDKHTGDPTEIALLRYAEMKGFDHTQKGRYRRELEVPFDASRARMTVVVRDVENGERLALVKGAPEVIVPRCARIRATPASEASREGAMMTATGMAEKSLRVLALAERRVTDGLTEEGLERDLDLLGFVGMGDPLRPEAQQAVRQAREAGIKVVMLTGDLPATAQSIGGALGLSGGVISGREVDSLSPDGLRAKMAEATIFARVTSDHKLDIVRAARAAGGVIAMTGDGVNDAPALRAADIGIAMGLGGTDVAREASDIVLTDDNFSSIVAAVEDGRTIHANISRFVHFLLACNAAEAMVVFAALAVAGEAVFTPLQLLFVNLVTDGLPALALGVEPSAPGIMRQLPRDPSTGLLSRRSLPIVLSRGLLIGLSTLLAFAIGKTWEGHELGVSLAFATLVGSQLAISIGFRSETQPLTRLKANPWHAAAVTLSALVVLGVFQVQVLREAFDIASLSLSQWAMAVALSLIPLAVTEGVKFIRGGAEQGSGRE